MQTPEFNTAEAVAFIESMRLTLVNRVGFRWMVERLSSLSALIESLAGENERLSAYLDRKALRDDYRAYCADYPGTAPPGEVRDEDEPAADSGRGPHVGSGSALPVPAVAPEIRDATYSDVAELQRYADQLFAENLPGVFRRRVPTLDEEREFVRSRIEPANSTLLVAVVDAEIVGLLDFVGGSLAEEAHAGTFGLSVGREHRGQGIGTALVDALVDWAPAHGIRRIQAWAWVNNPHAIALYERLGFVREGLCRQAVVSDGKPIDVVLLARLLGE